MFESKSSLDQVKFEKKTNKKNKKKQNKKRLKLHLTNLYFADFLSRKQ